MLMKSHKIWLRSVRIMIQTPYLVHLKEILRVQLVVMMISDPYSQLIKPKIILLSQSAMNHHLPLLIQIDHNVYFIKP